MLFLHLDSSQRYRSFSEMQKTGSSYNGDCPINDPSKIVRGAIISQQSIIRKKKLNQDIGTSKKTLDQDMMTSNNAENASHVRNRTGFHNSRKCVHDKEFKGWGLARRVT